MIAGIVYRLKALSDAAIHRCEPDSSHHRFDVMIEWAEGARSICQRWGLQSPTSLPFAKIGGNGRRREHRRPSRHQNRSSEPAFHSDDAYCQRTAGTEASVRGLGRRGLAGRTGACGWLGPRFAIGSYVKFVRNWSRGPAVPSRRKTRQRRQKPWLLAPQIAKPSPVSQPATVPLSKVGPGRRVECSRSRGGKLIKGYAGRIARR